MKKIIQNPYRSAADKILSQIASSEEVEIASAQTAGELWNPLKTMTADFGRSEVDIFDDHKMALFGKYGWIEYRTFLSPSINAFALTHNRLQYLVFNYGLLFALKDVYYSLFATKEFYPQLGDSQKEIFELKQFKENFEKVRKEGTFFTMIPKCEIRRNCAKIMAEVAVTFIYAHELLHLFQCHSIYEYLKYGTFGFYEFPMQRTSKAQDFDKRSLEIEADRGGTYFVLDYVNRGYQDNRFKDFKGVNPLGLCIATIEILFFTLNPYASFIEKEESTHPNNFIRIMSVFEVCMQEAMKLKWITTMDEGQREFENTIDATRRIFSQLGFEILGFESIERSMQQLSRYRQRCDYLRQNDLKPLMSYKQGIIRADLAYLNDLKNQT